MSQEFVSLFSDPEHISRHFSGATTVGSKFFAQAQNVVLNRAEQSMRQAFDTAQESGENAGRVVLKIIVKPNNFHNP